MAKRGRKSPPPDEHRCKGWAKQAQRRCLQYRVPTYDMCATHGGKTPRGMQSGSYKTGAYSKVLPVRLAATYEQARNDPRLLSTREHVALCDAQLTDLFRKLDTGESGRLWAELQAAHQAFRAATQAGDQPKMRQALDTIGALIARGSAETHRWGDIQSLWKSRCQLVETELKVLVASQYMLSVEQLGVFLGMLTDAVQRTVLAHLEKEQSDRVLGAISRELDRLTTRELRRTVAPAHG